MDGAQADVTTKWPNGFNTDRLRQAGVRIDQEHEANEL